MLPTEILDDVVLLNDIIGKDNFKQNDNDQKPIRKVTKAEFIIFHSLFIAASAHTGHGGKLWNIGSTTAYTMRGIKSAVYYGNLSENVEFMEKRCIIADSWFECVTTDAAIGMLCHNAVLMVKTAHSRIVTKLEQNMKDYPGGT